MAEAEDSKEGAGQTNQLVSQFLSNVSALTDALNQDRNGDRATQTRARRPPENIGIA